MSHKFHIPLDVSELVDQLGFMMLRAPTFRDDFFPHQNVETVFIQVNEGLKNARSELGEDRYDQLMSLSDRMKAHFLADPDDRNGETSQGRRLIHEMQVLLIGRSL